MTTERAPAYAGHQAHPCPVCLTVHGEPLEVKWVAEWRVHPAQDQWDRMLCVSEQEANDWVDRWMRGVVVIEARVIREDRNLIRLTERSAT